MDDKWIEADGFEWRRDGRVVYLRPAPTEPADSIVWTLPLNAKSPVTGPTTRVHR